MWIIRQTLVCIRFALPQALLLFLHSLWWALRLIAAAAISLFTGVWPTVVKLSEHWVAEALAHGFPNLWERRLRFFFRALAVLTITVGWIIILFTEYHVVSWGVELLISR